MTQRRIYQKGFPYFITFCTGKNYFLFEDVKYVKLLSDVIFKTCKIKNYDILAYQIMPDHVHILIVYKYAQAQPAVVALQYKIGSAGRAARARGKYFNISELMHGIKSYYCDQVRDQYGINYSIFQKRFYARIIDTDKYLEIVLYYIRNNPIKAKLFSRFHKFPYQYIKSKIWDNF